MKVSTNCLMSIFEYDRRKEVCEMNVSDQAVSAFVGELKLDSSRYKNLADNIRQANASSRPIPTSKFLQERIQNAIPDLKCATDALERMALKLQYHLRRNRTIEEVQDVLFYSALTREDAALSRAGFDAIYSGEAPAVRKGKRAPRHFKTCLGCQSRFLAKRIDNLTCSPKCRQRLARSASMSQIPEMTPLEAA